MKKFILLISVALVIAGCGQKQQKETSINNLSGEWVMDGYMNEVIKNQSPMVAGKILDGYTGVCIGKASKGEAFVLILINNHEGITGKISQNKKGHKEGSFAFQCDSEIEDVIDISLTEHRGSILMEIYDKKGEIVKDRKYTFVADFHDINDPCGLTAVKVLLADRWALLDAKDKKIGDVVIDSLGKVKGWGEYVNIGVATDPVFGGEDEISLRTDNVQGTIWYVADFMGDRIVLYEAIASDSSPVDFRGRQRFSLIRDNIGL